MSNVDNPTTFPTQLNDRRSFVRTPPEEPSVLFVSTPTGDSVVAEICDVSPEGVGIVIGCSDAFTRDCEIVIDDRRHRLQGTVVNVVQIDDARSRLGVKLHESVLSQMAERRNASRHKPAHDVQVVLHWDDSDVSYRADVYDIGAGGIGIIVDDRLRLEVDCQLRVEYQELQLLASTTNIRPLEDGFRVGLCWQQLAPVPHRDVAVDSATNPELRPREIVVGLVSQDLLYLKQIDGEQQDVITVSRRQLVEIVDFLSNPKSTRFVATCDTTDEVIVRLSTSDKRFSLVQGDAEIFGIGDLRQLIKPETTASC